MNLVSAGWRRGLSFRVAIFFGLAVALLAGAAAAPVLLSYVARAFPDNYLRRAEEALQHGDFTLAREIAQRRISRVGWDMKAHYLLARAFAADRMPDKAVGTILETLHKAESAQGRKITVTGYDEALSLRLLGSYLWEAGRYQLAGEMYRAAVDAGSTEVGPDLLSRWSAQPLPVEAAEAAASVFLKLRDHQSFLAALAQLEGPAASDSARARALVLHSRWAEAVDRNSAAALELLSKGTSVIPPAVLTTPLVRLELAGALRRTGHSAEAAELEDEVRTDQGVRSVSFEGFSLPNGAEATSRSLSLGRRGTASIRTETGAFRVTNLLVQASGTPALDQWPIVAVSSGGNELTRLYLDGLQPRVFDLSVYPEGVAKTVELGLNFLNDAYDPATRADRNVAISFLAFH